MTRTWSWPWTWTWPWVAVAVAAQLRHPIAAVTRRGDTFDEVKS